MFDISIVPKAPKSSRPSRAKILITVGCGVLVFITLFSFLGRAEGYSLRLDYRVGDNFIHKSTAHIWVDENEIACEEWFQNTSVVGIENGNYLLRIIMWGKDKYNPTENFRFISDALGTPRKQLIPIALVSSEGYAWWEEGHDDVNSIHELMLIQGFPERRLKIGESWETSYEGERGVPFLLIEAPCILELSTKGTLIGIEQVQAERTFDCFVIESNSEGKIWLVTSGDVYRSTWPATEIRQSHYENASLIAEVGVITELYLDRKRGITVKKDENLVVEYHIEELGRFSKKIMTEIRLIDFHFV